MDIFFLLVYDPYNYNSSSIKYCVQKAWIISKYTDAYSPHVAIYVLVDIN